MAFADRKHSLERPAGQPRLLPEQPVVVNIAPPAQVAAVAPIPTPEPPAATVAPQAAIFNDVEQRSLLSFARGFIETAVHGRRSPITLPVELARRMVDGLFVTLRRPTTVRASRGHCDMRPMTIGSLLPTVAYDTARHDAQHPPIELAELPLLELELSVIVDATCLTATGEDRIEAIQVGSHGVCVMHPAGRAIMLPHVAIESGWDAKQLLEESCLKAGLNADAWRRDEQARIYRFRTVEFASPAPRPELDARSLHSERLQRLYDHIDRLRRGLPSRCDDTVLRAGFSAALGLKLYTHDNHSVSVISCDTSMDELARHALQQLAQQHPFDPAAPDPVTRLSILWQPITLRSREHAQQLDEVPPPAVVARKMQQWSLVLRGDDTHDVVSEAMRNLNIDPRHDWLEHNTTITTFELAHFEPRQAPAATLTRPAARAGQFYPAEAHEIVTSVDRHLASAGPYAANHRRTCRAVMLPHGGWHACGEIIGKTLAHIDVPQRIIILGPKHTRHGHDHAVPPHHHWTYPGAQVTIDREMSEQLADASSIIKHDIESHRLEHSSEVLLPFLHRVQPQLRVTPVVLSARMSYEQTTELADALAQVISRSPQPPLLVISSDLNHYLPEEQNRLLDQLALDAMLAGDPRELFETCRRHAISMCGLVPAVVAMQALIRLKPRLKIDLIDYRTAGQTMLGSTRVVGYAGVTIA